MEDSVWRRAHLTPEQGRLEFCRLQGQPEMIVSFVRHAGLSVAGLP
jgi:hypothetical protein